MTSEAEPAEAPGAVRDRRRRLANLALLVIAAASLAVVYDELPDLGQVWSVAIAAEPGWLVVVIVAEMLSMGAFARLQRRLLKGGGLHISLRRAFAVTYAGNALSTTLPAGPAVSVVYTFRQFRKSGATAQLATAVILVGGVVTTTAYSLIALVALLAEPHSRTAALVTLSSVAAFAGALGLALGRASWRARLAVPAGRIICGTLRHPRIAPYATQLSAGRRLLRLSPADWGAIAAFGMLNWLFDIIALVAATHAVGLNVTPYGVALAYFAAQAAGSLLPLLPGGLGAVESAMAGALVALGAGLIPAGAAVGVYRIISYWAVVAVGWLAWLALRESPWSIPGVTRPRLMAVWRALGSGFAGAAALPYDIRAYNSLAYRHAAPAEAPRTG